MNTTLIHLDGLARELKVELPIDVFNTAVKAELTKTAKTIKLDGFRPGKVPAVVVEKKFGASIRAEVAQKMVSETLPKAFAKEGVSPAATPNLTDLILDDKAFLKFNVTFDIFPKINLSPVEELEFAQTTCNISEADIQQTLTDLTKQQATYAIVDKEAQDTDKVNIDFTGRVDGEVFEGGESKAFDLVLGEKKMIVGFEDGLMGKKAGEDFLLNISFPQDYQAPELAGKAAIFEIKVNSISCVELPPLDEELAKKYNQTSVAGLTSSAKKHMETELNKQLISRNKEAVFDALIQANPVEIPESSIKDEANNLLADMKQRMGEKSAKTDNISAELFNDKAKKRLQLGLLVAKVCADYGLEVGKDQIQDRITDIAKQHNQPEEQVKSWYYEDPSRLSDIESSLTEDLVVKHLVKTAKVTTDEKTFSEVVYNT